jgi:hypothetical protein
MGGGGYSPTIALLEGNAGHDSALADVPYLQLRTHNTHDYELREDMQLSLVHIPLTGNYLTLSPPSFLPSGSSQLGPRSITVVFRIWLWFCTNFEPYKIDQGPVLPLTANPPPPLSQYDPCRTCLFRVIGVWCHKRFAQCRWSAEADPCADSVRSVQYASCGYTQGGNESRPLRQHIPNTDAGALLRYCLNPKILRCGCIENAQTLN